MCVYLFAPSRGQPLCFSLWINNSATLGKIKTFKFSGIVVRRDGGRPFSNSKLDLIEFPCILPHPPLSILNGHNEINSLKDRSEALALTVGPLWDQIVLILLAIMRLAVCSGLQLTPWAPYGPWIVTETGQSLRRTDRPLRAFCSITDPLSNVRERRALISTKNEVMWSILLNKLSYI